MGRWNWASLEDEAELRGAAASGRREKRGRKCARDASRETFERENVRARALGFRESVRDILSGTFGCVLGLSRSGPRRLTTCNVGSSCDER